MNGVIEGGSKVMLHRSAFGEREESQVGDYRTGFIVIAVLLKNTETVCPHLSTSSNKMRSSIQRVCTQFLYVFVNALNKSTKLSLPLPRFIFS